MKAPKKPRSPARTGALATKQTFDMATQSQVLLNSVSADRSDVPIYFLHIPKTVGSSLTTFLQTLYNKSEIYGRFPGWAEVLRVSHDELARSRVICGHLGTYLNSYYKGELRPFTFVREPLGRALSHYEHVKRDTNHYFHKVANELGTFGAFMRDPRTQPTVSNFQVRHLAANVDPSVIAATLNAQQLAARELERLIDTCDLGESLGELLERASQNLERMCFVGIAEQFDRSLGLLCEIFGWPAPDTVPITNVNPNIVSLDSLSDADRALLTDLNAADLALYASAKSRFEKDWTRSRFVYPDLHAFISYAQNFEDVLLHRVLAHVEQGTYIDIGANDPTGDSVTRAFYDRGWRGINVEPVTSLHKMLLVHRTRDINLQIAAGAANGETCLYEIPGTGLSTLDGAIAERHEAMGFAVERREIKVRTLDSALAEHPLEAIHFLKVDVEGWEREVLEGIDLTRHRPWIIVVEATEPNSQIPSFAPWEPILISRRYQFAYFDGLNRFYVADEHPELLQGFLRPINSADHFIRWSELSAKRELRRLNWGLRRQTAASRESEVHVAALTEWANSADRHGKALFAERGLLRTELEAERARRETESNEAKRQIDALLESRTSAEAYCKSLIKQADQLEAELNQQRRAHELDLVEAKNQIDALTESKISADVYCKSLVERADQLEAELVQQRQAREFDLLEARKQIDALTEWTTSADVYCKSLLERADQLDTELNQQRRARELDLVEARKQIDALTKRTASADVYCKSLVERAEQLDAELIRQRQARELDLAEATKQIDALKDWTTSADAYCRSLVERTEKLEAELSLVRVARDAERLEALKQIDGLTESLTRADVYCKSILSSNAHLEDLLASQRADALSAQTRADDQIASVAQRATIAERRLGSLSAIRDQLEASRDAERNSWLTEKSALRTQVGDLQQQLSRLLQHWVVRTLVGKEFTSNSNGKTKHE